MRLSRFVAPAFASVLAVGGLALSSPTPSFAAPGGGGCQLSGTATFSPNGPGGTQTFGYSFNGSLSGCQSNVSGAPASGTIGAGQVVTESVPITTSTGSVVQGTAQYQEPRASGTGNIPANSCPAGSTSGTAVINWTGGTITVASFTTQSAAAAVNLTGTVVAGVAATVVPGSANPPGTAPATYTISTNNPSFPVGDGAQGVLTFTTSDPTQCNTSAGLTSAAVSGFVGLGSTS